MSEMSDITGIMEAEQGGNSYSVVFLGDNGREYQLGTIEVVGTRQYKVGWMELDSIGAAMDVLLARYNVKNRPVQSRLRVNG